MNKAEAGTIPQDTSTQEVAQEQNAIATPGEQEAATET
jgi:hypothetical protein